MRDEWKTLAEEAARTKLSLATLRRAIRARRLRCARVGGRKAIRLKEAWTDDWLMATTTPVEERR